MKRLLGTILGVFALSIVVMAQKPTPPSGTARPDHPPHGKAPHTGTPPAGGPRAGGPGGPHHGKPPDGHVGPHGAPNTGSWGGSFHPGGTHGK